MEEIAQSYQDVINNFMHNPRAIFLDKLGRHVYMRPYEYSMGMILGDYVANVTLVPTIQEPINTKINKNETS